MNPIDEASGLGDDLANMLEDTGVRVEELIEELLEAVELAQAIGAALQAGEHDVYTTDRVQSAQATSAGLAAVSAALRGAWDAVPDFPQEQQ